MSAPARVLYASPNTYRLDPYVRDARGRFAPHPTVPLPPIAAIETVAAIVVEQRERPTAERLFGGAMIVSKCDGNHWTIKRIREHDGSYRVEFIND